MEFIIATTGHFYNNKKRRTELNKIGFTFKQTSSKDFTIEGEPTIEIKNLSELIQFAEKWGEVIVSNGNIRIYDDCYV